MIRLSVIVPFFNVERFAAENLSSLVHSAAADIEFVLVDDGSTDATSSIVAEGVERLPRGNLIRLPRNSWALGCPQRRLGRCPRPLSQLS